MTRNSWLICLLATAAVAGALRCSRHPVTVASRAASAAVASKVAVPYAAVIVTPERPSSQLQTSINDALDALSHATGARFKVSVGASGPGIVLLRSTDKAVSEDERQRLVDKGPEAFLIRSSDTRELRIVANADIGLAYGVYHYLRQIGCRWFLPGDDWTILPELRDATFHGDAVIAPAFRSRGFFGTGGFGPPTPVDPKLAMPGRWELWKLRNGYGGEYAIGGHTGEAFVAAHRAELTAHPEYLALVREKRGPLTEGTRLCVSNRAAVKLYVDDRLTAMRRAIAADPSTFAISVESADGFGHCECGKCATIGTGTESDQNFYLANQVAKAVAKEFPGRYVSLLAYAGHAAPPSIPLEPNVFVTVVPEAFQRTGMSPAALIDAWSRHAKRLGVYTYWAVSDWSLDLPSFDWRTIPAQSIRAWHAAHIESVSLQTTNGVGAAGLGLYVASRLLWNPEEDVSALATEFMNLAFGRAAPPMKRLLERWSAGFMVSAFELGLSYQDLAEARRLAVEPAVRKRIADYESYLHYVRLWIEFQGAPPGSALRKDRARALVTWLYRSYDTGMVGSHRMRELVVNKFERDPALGADFAPANPHAPGWEAATRPVLPQELASLMKDGAHTYPPPDLTPRSYSTKLVRASNAPLPAAGLGVPLPLVGTTDFEIEVPPGRAFEMELQVRSGQGPVSDQVTVSAMDGHVVHDEAVPADGGPHMVRFAIDPGRYHCRIFDQKAAFRLRLPADLPVAFSLAGTTVWDLSPRLYFWVPRGIRKLGLFSQGITPLELFNGDGVRVPTPVTGLIVVDVPKDQDGRAWSYQRYKGAPMRPINVPNVLSPSPGQLLVPEDALR